MLTPRQAANILALAAVSVFTATAVWRWNRLSGCFFCEAPIFAPDRCCEPCRQECRGETQDERLGLFSF